MAATLAGLIWACLAGQGAAAGSLPGRDGVVISAKATSCTPLDVALVVDDTGSMGPAIANVKEGLEKIIADTETAGKGDFRMQLVTFKDTVEVDEPFRHDDGVEMRVGVKGLRATGGESEPEASDEALKTAILALSGTDRAEGLQTGTAEPFRPKAEKLIVLVTDARPGGFDDKFTAEDSANALAVARLAKQRGVRISGVFENTNGLREAQGITAQYAEVTGGYFRVAKRDGSDTGIALRTAIILCGRDYSACDKTRTTVVGTVAGEAIRGTGKRDIIAALGEDDAIDGNDGGDLICGDGGRDVIRGGDGKDRIFGGPLGDRISGGDGRDDLRGGGGYDRFQVAGGGPDRVKCASGIDTVVADPTDRIRADCENITRR